MSPEVAPERCYSGTQAGWPPGTQGRDAGQGLAPGSGGMGPPRRSGSFLDSGQGAHGPWGCT